MPLALADNETTYWSGILILGLIPIALVLIYALLQRGGSLSFQGVKIDLAATTSPAVAFRIDTNIGVQGEAVSDSSSREILDAQSAGGYFPAFPPGFEIRLVQGGTTECRLARS